MGIAHTLRIHAYTRQQQQALLQNDFKIGSSKSGHFFWLKFKPFAKWPLSSHSHQNTSLSLASVFRNKRRRRNNWAFVHACAATTTFPPFVAVLARILKSILVGGEKGYYILRTTGNKWVAGLQEGYNMLKKAELANDGIGVLQQWGGGAEGIRIGMALLSTTTSMAKERISPVLGSLGANPTFMSGLLAWVLAQMLKVVTTFVVERRWDLRMLVGSGGMPSSHTALCLALTTSVALCEGVSDSLFPVCLGFSLIVMYDAAGVRRHAGMQAEVLNLIVEDLFKGHPISEKKLKELLGHTPLQVFAGACLGVLVGYLCSHSCSVGL